jgi:hypothetical protein
LLERLSQHKPAIVELAQPRADGWLLEDWQAFFDERAVIAEFDGGLPPPGRGSSFLRLRREWLDQCASSLTLKRICLGSQPRPEEHFWNAHGADCRCGALREAAAQQFGQGRHCGRIAASRIARKCNGQVRLGILGQVSRYARGDTIELGHRALVEGRESNEGKLADAGRDRCPGGATLASITKASRNAADYSDFGLKLLVE